jgi:hypothetical protein
MPANPSSVRLKTGLFHLVCLLGLALPAGAEIVLPPQAADCVKWAAADLTAAIRDAGTAPYLAEVSVSYGAEPEPSAQAFQLTVQGAKVSIAAGGPNGAMYGLQELAEQIHRLRPTEKNSANWADLAAGLKPTAQHPFMEVRADNAFVHVYPLLLNDREQWRAYIDQLARNRFNVLDLHGAFDLQSTSFPNLYPMLVHVPEYPNIGNEAEQARNLESFRSLISYAKSRGVQVWFMNYSANDGRGGAEKNAPSITGVPPEKLADYTAKAVAGLIKALPELALLGFRVGESGRDAAFFQDSYLKGVKDAERPDLRLYTRSWQTTKEQLLPIAAIAPSGFDIEVKYNGEQLGLPYHALQTNFGTYSYETYLDIPASYRIIWQVRANGTHRFWTWEGTDFIRRTVRTFSLGNARGFTLEPPIAYFSTDPATRYRSASDRAVYRYMWQKYWAWYAAWGRMSYDPDWPEWKLIRIYEDHFGPEAGAQIYAAQQQASIVVPLVLAYRFPGPDHRDFSPETETGNVSAKRKGKIPLLLQFIDLHPEDERSFASIGAYVDAKLAGNPDGRVGPLAVANRLATAAQLTRKSVDSVAALSGTAADEWRLLKVDLLSASHLADYYAARITGLVHFDYALKTGNKPEYETGVEGLAASRAAWKQLGETADAVYAPLSNPLRKQLNFQWSAQLSSIEAVDATAPALWANRAHSSRNEIPAATPRDRGEPSGIEVSSLRHVISPARDEVTITCSARLKGARGAADSSLAAAILWYKPLPSALTWEHRPMTRSGPNTFSATTRLTREGLMYLVEVQTTAGVSENFPQVFQSTPYQIVPPYAPNP